MLCDKCKVNEACYHSTLVINGEVKSTHLCEQCAINEGVFSKPHNSIFDEFKAFTDFLGFDNFEDKTCLKCGLTLRKFRKTGLLGCNSCYKVFEQDIDDVVRRIQPYTENKFENVEFNIEQKKKELTKQEKLNKLKSDLQKAISEERYEDAGVINKEIKKLTKELQGE